MNTHLVNAVAQVDRTFLLIFVAAVFFLVLITACMVTFLIRYHHQRNAQAADIRGNTLLEIVWIVIPSLIALGMFYSGWQSYLALQNAPENAMPVTVTARKWSWTFTYENGRISNILYVPVNQPVRLILKSVDVIHSFYAPAFRLKRDAVPGMTTYAWFLPEKAGEFSALCAEYCGYGHSAMVTNIKVMPVQQFNDWYEHGTVSGESAGLEVYVKQGCVGCHPTGGISGVGPNLQDIFGKSRRVTENGSVQIVTADEEYLRSSILYPDREVVQGYRPVMPSYAGKISEQELEILVTYLKTHHTEAQ